MIDISKFDGFTLEQLIMFRDSLGEAIIKRKNSMPIQHRNRTGPFKVGDKLSFRDKGGNIRIIVAHRINAKTITGQEISGSGIGGKWRVSPSLLTLWGD